MTIIKNEKQDIFKMSIQVRLNGFSFCILNCSHNEIAWYKKIDLGKEHSPVEILKEIEKLYAEETILQNEFQEVIVLFSNNLYTLVPESFFIEEEASTYLKFNTKILKTDVVAHDVLSHELVNVYIPYTNINNYFFDKYGEFEFRNNISVLIEAVLAKHNESKNAQVYLNDYSSYYDLVVVKNNKLLLANTFQYETKEDFIYYLLFSAEQLEIDPAEFNLWLLGDISRDSDNFSIAYTYIQNIDFLIPSFNFTSILEQSETFHREAFSLLKTLKCE
ncbi:uncharacterized protein DUF3822 [Gillisia mitskevichiae]|uniref:Uncharacterized protein DUF3822 n=1 Tax=Gillisia mitskevichiae TaxID=270921 RepID=A0A495PRU6_9FLAO|nr:DUF3822 family protein [Gillisia mitskevichiae]RKS52927.1 uncharacterized protein DUF3822 [Gillisia mitskevichiae]